jgi:hypothetical protein
VNGIC